MMSNELRYYDANLFDDSTFSSPRADDEGGGGSPENDGHHRSLHENLRGGGGTEVLRSSAVLTFGGGQPKPSLGSSSQKDGATKQEASSPPEQKVNIQTPARSSGSPPKQEKINASLHDDDQRFRYSELQRSSQEQLATLRKSLNMQHDASQTALQFKQEEVSALRLQMDELQKAHIAQVESLTSDAAVRLRESQVKLLAADEQSFALGREVAQLQSALDSERFFRESLEKENAHLKVFVEQLKAELVVASQQLHEQRLELLKGVGERPNVVGMRFGGSGGSSASVSVVNNTTHHEALPLLSKVQSSGGTLQPSSVPPSLHNSSAHNDHDSSKIVKESNMTAAVPIANYVENQQHQQRSVSKGTTPMRSSNVKLLVSPTQEEGVEDALKHPVNRSQESNISSSAVAVQVKTDSAAMRHVVAFQSPDRRAVPLQSNNDRKASPTTNNRLPNAPHLGASHSEVARQERSNPHSMSSAQLAQESVPVPTDGLPLRHAQHTQQQQLASDQMSHLISSGLPSTTTGKSAQITKYRVVEELEKLLYSRCRERDEVEGYLRKYENIKIRSLSDKAKKDSLQKSLMTLNQQIGEVRLQLRNLSALER